MNRKDDHLNHALSCYENNNGLDKMHLEFNSLRIKDLANVNIECEYANFKLSAPFFISAMSGGSDKALEINRRLAMLARDCDLMMSTGSIDCVIKDDSKLASFEIIRTINPNGILILNSNANRKLAELKPLITKLKPNLLAVHLNPIQELCMDEGDRIFSKRNDNLRDLLNSEIPIIIKEVGFGMSKECLYDLQELGFKYVNIAAKGGTNFALIENKRNNNRFPSLSMLGYNLYDSLMNAREYNLDIIASGGINSASDIIKSLVLGAKICGMANYFLDLVTSYEHAECVVRVNNLKEEIRRIMAILNVNKVSDLAKVKYRIKA